MLVVTTEKIPGQDYQVIGLVKGSTIQCKISVGISAALLRTWWAVR